MGYPRRFYWRLRHEWKVHYLLPLLIFVPLFWFFWHDPFHAAVENGKPVIAQITRISIVGNKYHKPLVEQRVTARTAEGAIGFILAFPKDITGCEVGDPIHAEQQGIRLYLKPAPCADEPTPASE